MCRLPRPQLPTPMESMAAATVPVPVSVRVVVVPILEQGGVRSLWQAAIKPVVADRILGMFSYHSSPLARPVRTSGSTGSNETMCQNGRFELAVHPDCLLGVPDCLMGAPDCYWVFSAIDWAFSAMDWALPKIGHRCVEMSVQFAPPYFFRWIGHR